MTSLPLLQHECMETEPSVPSDSLQIQISKFTTMVTESYKKKPIHDWILLVLSIMAMLVASPSSSILSRVYYDNGGQSKWFISWVAFVGWPLPALVMLSVYFISKTFPTPLSLKLSLSYIILGFLTAADNLMYAYSYAYLPASTASLVASSSLVFSALFGYFLVKNKVNVSIVNSVFIITAALTIVALDSSSDRYASITDSEYIMGFVLNVVGSALHGLVFALSELVFVKLLGRRSFIVVLEQQVMVSLFAFLFASVGMIVSGDFQRIGYEAATFKGGISPFYLVITLQLELLGFNALIFLGSTVLAGVVYAVTTPITSIAAVILLHDPMSGFKILSLVITFWGFGSYIYGEKSS